MDLSALNADSLAMVLQHNHERWRNEDNAFITNKIKELRQEMENGRRKYTNAQVYYAMIATGEHYSEHIKSIKGYDAFDPVKKEGIFEDYVNLYLPEIAKQVKELREQDNVMSHLQHDEEKMMSVRYGKQVGVDTVV